MESLDYISSLQSENSVLIIGNGFDLDLGLKTSYHAFYESRFWPFKNPDTIMGAFLNQEKQINNWMDLEEKIGEYGVRSYYDSLHSLRGKHYRNNNNNDYNSITEKLYEYLLEVETAEIETDSTAATVLINQMESTSTPTIITFNYTNIRNIAQRLGITKDFDPLYVHGNLKDHNIVLGVGENYTYNNTPLPISNDFLYKTSSPHYSPPQISGILSQAEHITFFGLSLGGMDAPYFSGLFQNLSKEEGKTISFFTLDEQSRLQLIRHLRGVKSINLNDIMTRHRFEFIRTKDGIDKTKLTTYISRLSNN